MTVKVVEVGPPLPMIENRSINCKVYSLPVRQRPCMACLPWAGHSQPLCVMTTAMESLCAEARAVAELGHGPRGWLVRPPGPKVNEPNLHRGKRHSDAETNITFFPRNSVSFPQPYLQGQHCKRLRPSADPGSSSSPRHPPQAQASEARPATPGLTSAAASTAPSRTCQTTRHHTTP